MVRGSITKKTLHEPYLTEKEEELIRKSKRIPKPRKYPKIKFTYPKLKKPKIRKGSLDFLFWGKKKRSRR